MRSVIGYGFLAPPNIFIVLGVLGGLVALVWRRAGMIVMLAASLSLFVAATPAFSSLLLVIVEAKIPKNGDLSSAQAIVVLAADASPGENGAPDRLGPQSLERLVFAVDAYKQLCLPIAVSGGRLNESETTAAEIMKVMLEKYFGIPVRWSEDRSQTTYENALYTTKMLQKADISTVILITQARDAPRAVWSFERAGLHALPWPAPRTVLEVDRIADFLPSTGALNRTFLALHELIGGLYYQLHY